MLAPHRRHGEPHSKVSLLWNFSPLTPYGNWKPLMEQKTPAIPECWTGAWLVPLLSCQWHSTGSSGLFHGSAQAPAGEGPGLCWVLVGRE